MEVTCAVLDETTEAYARTNIECLTEEDRQYEGTTDRRYSKQSVCGGGFGGTLPGGGSSGGGEDPLGGGYDDGQQTICITCGIDNRSGGGGGEQTQAEKLADYLEAHPLALLDVPCEDIPKYEALAEHTAPQSVIERLNQDEFELVTPEGLTQQALIQTLEEATGPAVNMDYYGVRVRESNLPNNMTAGEYYEHWRTNFNDYFSNDRAQFDFYPGLSNEDERWQNSPLGTVFSIQLMAGGVDWVDDGSVVTTGYDGNDWTFSTAWTPEDFRHPVSGNRKFGFKRDGNYVTFYTRGVDRITARDYGAANFLSRLAKKYGGIGNGPVVFSSGDDVWKDLVQHLKQDFGNGAEDVSEEAIRPDYDKFQKVMDGEADPAALGCSM